MMKDFKQFDLCPFRSYDYEARELRMSYFIRYMATQQLLWAFGSYMITEINFSTNCSSTNGTCT